MDSLIDICKDKLVGYYSGVDRLRISGPLRRLQHPGAVVNFMKALYPNEPRPLRHFADLTQRFRTGVEALVARGIPYLEAKRVSDISVLKWLEPLYARGPRAGTLVAIVRTIETVASFSCRPRQPRRAKGDPRSGRRPVEEAAPHLSRQPHNVAVADFYVCDTPWGRASVRICSYLPFDVSWQLNGQGDLERPLHRHRRQITMADNAVAAVNDWPALRALATANLEPARRRFAAYWLARRPHGLLSAARAALGESHWCLQTVEICRNFIFRSVQDCQPVFETLLRHTQLVGSPDTLRVLFGLRHRPHRPTSSPLTRARPLACFKAFSGSPWVKCSDKQGFILRFELVMNCVPDFVAPKKLRR